MERSVIEDRARLLTVDHLGVDAKEVTDSADFVDDLGADSLDVVELMMAIEEEFNIEVPDDAAEKIDTFKDAVDYIASKV